MSKEFTIGNKLYKVIFHKDNIRVHRYKSCGYSISFLEKTIIFKYSDIKFGPTILLEASWVPLQLLNIIKRYADNKAFW